MLEDKGELVGDGMKEIKKMIDALNLMEQVQRLRLLREGKFLEEWRARGIQFSHHEKYSYGGMEVPAEQAMVLFALGIMSEGKAFLDKLEDGVGRDWRMGERELARTALSVIVRPEGSPLGWHNGMEFVDKNFKQLLFNVKSQWGKWLDDVEYFAEIGKRDLVRGVFNEIFGSYELSKAKKAEIRQHDKSVHLARADEVLARHVGDLTTMQVNCGALEERLRNCGGMLHAIERYQEWETARMLAGFEMESERDDASRIFDNAINDFNRVRDRMWRAEEIRKTSLWGRLFGRGRVSKEAKNMTERCLQRLYARPELENILFEVFGEKVPQNAETINELLEYAIDELAYKSEQVRKRFEPDLKYAEHREFKEIFYKHFTEDIRELLGADEWGAQADALKLWRSRPNDMPENTVRTYRLADALKKIIDDTGEQIAKMGMEQLEKRKQFYTVTLKGVIEEYLNLMYDPWDRRLEGILIAGEGMRLAERFEDMAQMRGAKSMNNKGRGGPA